LLGLIDIDYTVAKHALEALDQVVELFLVD
jgi:hypothetical protein